MFRIRLSSKRELKWREISPLNSCSRYWLKFLHFNRLRWVNSSDSSTQVIWERITFPTPKKKLKYMYDVNIVKLSSIKRFEKSKGRKSLKRRLWQNSLPVSFARDVSLMRHDCPLLFSDSRLTCIRVWGALFIATSAFRKQSYGLRHGHSVRTWLHVFWTFHGYLYRRKLFSSATILSKTIQLKHSCFSLIQVT